MKTMLGIVSVLAFAAILRADEDLASAVKKTSELKSYAFKAFQGPKKEAVLQAEYQAGQPSRFVAEKIEFLKKGNVLIYQENGKWHKCKTGIESDPLRILGASAKVRQQTMPHEELAGFEKNFKAAKKTGKAEYTGELTLEACRKLLSPADRALAKRGRATLRLDADGLIREYQISIDIEGRRGNAEVMGTVTRDVVIENPGAVAIKITDEQKKLLD
jgi:hypothetical protein